MGGSHGLEQEIYFPGEIRYPPTGGPATLAPTTSKEKPTTAKTTPVVTEQKPVVPGN